MEKGEKNYTKGSFIPKNYFRRRSNKEFGLHKPSYTHRYHDKLGNPQGFILRWDITQEDGTIKKEFRPFLYCDGPNGDKKWVSRGFPEPRPLYNLHELSKRPNDPVLVVEGEKTANAALKLLPGYIATTAMNGAQSPHKSNWSPLKYRDVVISIDRDDAGEKYGKEVFRLCQQEGARSVQFLNMSLFAQSIVQDGDVITQNRELPKGYDLADALAEGWTAELIHKLGTMLQQEGSSLFTAYPETTTQEAVNGQFEGYSLDEWPEPLPIPESELLPVLAFDCDKLLPPILRGFVKDCAHRTQTPPDLIAAPLIAMFSALLGANYRMRPKQYDDWAEVPNLWSMIIAPPGSLKSHCLTEALKPIKSLATKARQAFKEDSKAYEEALQSYEMEKKALEKALKAAFDKKVQNNRPEECQNLEEQIQTCKTQLSELKKPDEPFEKRYLTSDSTIEMLQELLKHNTGGLIVERDELISLLTSFEMPGRESDRGFYLAGWNGGGDYQVDRIVRGSPYVPHLCLSLVGTTQPEKIQAYIAKNTTSLANDGLIQRFQLTVYPDSLKRKYVDQRSDQEAKNTVYKIAQTIASSEFLSDHKQTLGFDSTKKDTPNNNNPLIIPFHFGPSAQELFKKWLEKLEKQIDDEEESILKEHWSKYRGLIPSLALIFHVIEIAATGRVYSPVTLEALQMAIAWHPYLESHARRIYGMSLNLGESAIRSLANQILAGKFEDGFSARDVYRKNSKGIGTDIDLAESACEKLVKLEWLREVYTPSSKGQKPKTEYFINPKLNNESLKIAKKAVDSVDTLKIRPTMSTLSTTHQGAFEKKEEILEEKNSQHPYDNGDPEEYIKYEEEYI
jgi:hypothetical protein